MAFNQPITVKNHIKIQVGTITPISEAGRLNISKKQRRHWKNKCTYGPSYIVNVNDISNPIDLARWVRNTIGFGTFNLMGRSLRANKKFKARFKCIGFSCKYYGSCRVKGMRAKYYGGCGLNPRRKWTWLVIVRIRISDSSGDLYNDFSYKIYQHKNRLNKYWFWKPSMKKVRDEDMYF